MKLSLKPAVIAILALVGSVYLAAQSAGRQFTCAACHVEAKVQPGTDMAHAMENASANPQLEKHPFLTFQLGAYHYTIETRATGSTYSVTDGKDTISLPIRWAFGHGTQTYVLEYKSQFYEGLVSFFPAINGLDITIGDQSIQPANIEQAIGRPLTPRETSACFGCHSTGSVVDRTLQLDKISLGITCEHCHVNTAEHLNAISHAKLTPIPPKLSRMSAEDAATFCGQCHRTWATVVQGRLLGQINVRFQPYRLETSKCFDGVDKRLTCMACHNPHEEVVRDDKAYDSKCLACHSADAKPSLGMLALKKDVPPANVRMTVCPVSNNNCVSCHMPKVNLPGGHIVFTDHDIRVVKANEPYPN